MEAIKSLILYRFKTLSLLVVTLTFSVTVLMIRMKLNQSFFFLFLMWNLFLALIPYTISFYLTSKENITTLYFAFGFIIWLLFLPNAPYMVTDFIHLRTGNNFHLWLDIIVILSFALSGLLLFFMSLLDMQKCIEIKFNKITIQTLTLSVIFLSGFGVYLGRFLRYNSWEVISQPQYLFKDISAILMSPLQYSEAWLFSLGFGTFLSVGFWLFKNFYRFEN